MVLASDKVHVWRASLELTPTAILALRRTLAADELARVKRFHFTEDRTRFIAARGALREILACYLGTEANQVCFRYSSHGKPALAPLGRGWPPEAKEVANGSHLCISPCPTLATWPWWPLPVAGGLAWTSRACART